MCCDAAGLYDERAVTALKRNAIEKLIRWKNSEERKPMVLKGARQVGKTWLMKEFGRICYDSTVYFNFDEEDELKSIFETNKNPNRIIELLRGEDSAGKYASDFRRDSEVPRGTEFPEVL